WFAVAWQRTLEELYSLSQWKFAGIVDGVGRAAHVGLPGIGAGFAAAASLLFTTECAADFSTGATNVDVGDTAVRARGRQEELGLGVVLGKDSRGQTLWHRIVQCDGVFEVRVGQHIQDRREGFIVHNF